MKKKFRTNVIAGCAGAMCFMLATGCTLKGLKSGTVEDEAKQMGLTAQDLPGSTDDYMRDMDHGLTRDQVAAALPHLSADEAWDAFNRGRNNWNVWTAGNDRFWDYLANNSFGAFDLLKTLSSHPGIRYCGNSKPIEGYDENGYPAAGYQSNEYGATAYPPGYYVYEDDVCEGDDRQWFEASRDNRWKYFGLVNEPCLEKATGPDPDRFGLWLDKWVEKPGCPERDPFEDEAKYPGVKFGARGRDGLPVGSYYGDASGIVGLRLFPNPDFDEKAEAAWDADRFYTDPDYYEDKDLVRPYRVGMSCGFCHVGPSPVNPPADPENPEWANLNSNPGAQYFWIDRIFFWNPEKRHENYIYQMFHTSLPGSLDTSLVSSDNINNPRTMNAIYNVNARLEMAKFHPEFLTGGELNNKQFNDYPQTEILSEFFEPPDKVSAAHVLKDGADSVGILGALNRVYINIGLASREWLTHFKELIGNLPTKRITPIEIAALEENSTYWNANAEQTPDVALFFLASARPDLLKNTPGGNAYLTGDQAKLDRGKIVFAENCASCHSGKQPPNLCMEGGDCGAGDIEERSPEYFAWMRNEVMKEDFLEGNFLSTETRYPVTLLETNACSPLATNGLRGDIWDNFTSTTYKELPAVGEITVHHPKTGEPWQYQMPGGGRGYTRPASLVSLWTSAPYLLNNSVGNFYGDASVAARMASFQDSIEKMLWPDKRRKDSVLGDKVPGYIQRTTHKSYLKVAPGYLPFTLRIKHPRGLQIGPIPKGTPVALLASLPFVSDSTEFRDKVAHFKALKRFVKKAVKDLKQLPDDASDERAREVFADLVDPLVNLSKCPDYVVNRGHYFGAKLPDDDKYALIEFLKTF